MEKENCKRKKVKRTREKTLTLSIRITEDVSKWLKENDYSPTGVFDEALRELGYKKE